MKSGHVIRQLRFLLPCVVLMALASTPAGAATNVVTTLADSGPGSLREAISNALSGDTIVFAMNGTITLTSGELVIAKDVHIIGPGATNLSVSGNFSNRIFNISATATGSISGLTVRNGRTQAGLHGGGIYNAGTFVLNNCVITANKTGNGTNGSHGRYATSEWGFVSVLPGSLGGAGGSGGGLYNVGTLTLTSCTISSNATADGGSGGYGASGISDTCFGGPGSSGGTGGIGGSGAGIYSLGGAILNDCVISGNITGSGGQGGSGGGGGYGIGFPGFCYGGNGGAGGFGGDGGGGSGIYNTGLLALNACALTGNVTGIGGGAGRGGTPGINWGAQVPGAPGLGGNGGGGAGIWNQGSLLITSSTINSNLCGAGGVGGPIGGQFNANIGGSGGRGGSGGGLWTIQATTTVVRCGVWRNRSGTGGQGGSAEHASTSGGPGGRGGDGGGIGSIGGTMTVVASTIGGNFSGNGGSAGVNMSASPDPTAGGGGGDGAGIFHQAGSLTIAACTLTANLCGSGGNGTSVGAGGNAGGISSGTNSPLVALWNTVVALNALGSPNGKAPDLSGVFISQGHNLIGIGDSSTGVTNNDFVGTASVPINPLLGPLVDNGGPTLTHALLPGSPAIDAGDDTLTGTDQRGRPRLSGAHVDIGAFEFQAPSPQGPGVRKLTNGTSQFSFTSFSDTTFNVLTATNVSLASTQWVNLGPATLITNGIYEFTESITVSNRHRFFQLRWP